MESVRNDTSRIEGTELEETQQTQTDQTGSEEVSEHLSYKSDDNFGAKAEQQTFIAKQRDVLVTKENYDSDDSEMNEDEIKKWKNKDDSGRSAQEEAASNRNDQKPLNPLQAMNRRYGSQRMMLTANFKGVQKKDSLASLLQAKPTPDL